MRLHIATVVGFCTVSAACGGLAPTVPSGGFTGSTADSAAPFTPPRSGIQRVEQGGGGGGNQCLLSPTTLCLTVTLASGGNALEVTTITFPYTANGSPLDYSIRATLFGPPSGISTLPAGILTPRFSQGVADLSVSGGFAHLSIALTGPGSDERTLVATGTAPVVQTQTPCAPSAGFFTTTITTTTKMNLQYLGRTDIVVVRTVVCTP